MDNIFMIIKPEGLAYFGEIVFALYNEVCFSDFSMFWIEDWEKVSLELYGHYFIDENRKTKMKALVHTEKIMFGNKAICVVFNKDNYSEQLQKIVQIKENIRQRIRQFHRNSIYYLLDLNKSGHVKKYEEVLTIQYEYDKPAKKISDVGFFQIQKFSYVHAPDPEKSRIIIENNIINDCINYKNKINAIEYEMLVKMYGKIDE